MIKLSNVLIIGVLGLSACSSIQRAELSSERPDIAIVEVESIRAKFKVNQIDLLANDEFTDGERHLKNAQEGLEDNEDREYIIKNLSQSKAYFLKAEKIATESKIVPERILTARKAALVNGVRKDRVLSERLGEVDSSLRSSTKNFMKELGVEKLSELENEYLNLEAKSVQNMELMGVRDIVKRSKKNEAQKKAPQTFRSANVSLNAAENMIKQSPRNPENYRKSVIEATVSAKLLDDVMKKLNGVASGSSEKTALELVHQERKLGLMSDRAKSLQSSLDRSQSDLGVLAGDYVNLSNEAKNAEDKVLLQVAMNDVRRNFSHDEAEVYQQGDALIIRLRNIDFKSGSSTVPSRSMDLLSRINSIIVNLKSPEVVIEGHTDSTGNKNNNNALSLKRSEAVANYLSSIGNSYVISSKGYGESHPIANNQTKVGRALNRRVDIVVSTNKNL